MKEEIVNKKPVELKIGDILAKDIPGKEALKSGVKLDKAKIEQIMKAGVEEVKIAVSETSGITTKEKSSKQEVAEQIKENIELAYLKNILSKSPEVHIKEEEYAPEIRKKAKELISHIKQSKKDIFKIESMPKKALTNINQRINNRLDDITKILMQIIKEKSFEINRLHKIVEELIEDTGPKRDSTFLLLHLKRTAPHLIVRHSINVALLSLSIAIELSKIMEQKLENPDVKGDFKKLDICNAKIFTKEELIKLGIAALLHDLGLVEAFPELKETSKFELKDKSKIELHPNRAYHLLTHLGVDYDIRKAIFQHHERCDGSGYPDGIKARFFTKYGLVLSFADYIDLITSKNPFMKKMHPHRAIMHILTKEREKFDADVLYSYCQAASLYPIGSWVLLSDTKIGVIMRSNKDNLKKPVIKCVLSSDLKELTKKEFVDLTRTNLKILELIDIESLEMFDEKIDRFLFDEREFERVKVDIEADINIVDTNIYKKVRIENISAGGARIYIPEKFIRGDEMYFNFSLDNKRFEGIKGLVAWEDGEVAGENRYGVRFIQMDEEDKNRIFQFTERQPK